MITDENGVKHPETIEEAAQMQHSENMVNRFFERKAKKEGWGKPVHNQGAKPESEKTAAERFFAIKAKREGWS